MLALGKCLAWTFDCEVCVEGEKAHVRPLPSNLSYLICKPAVTKMDKPLAFPCSIHPGLIDLKTAVTPIGFIGHRMTAKSLPRNCIFSITLSWKR